MGRLVKYLQYLDDLTRFNLIPGRIFLDTNVLQYVQDFGEYIFEHCRESEAYFQSIKRKIYKGERLFTEIEALHDFFLNVNRANFEFALSEAVYREVTDKGDSSFLQWFNDVWDHWSSVVSDYEADEGVSPRAEKDYQEALADKSLSCSISKKGLEIVLDAIRYDCDALLTTDRFARNQNKKLYIFQNYKFMILMPSEFMEIIKPYQALWC
jgi:hypothetical protein